MAVKIFKVEISNRRGKSYKVEDKRPLLDSLKERVLISPMVANMVDVSRVLQNLFMEK